LRSVDLLAANPLMGRLRTELRRPVRLHRFRSHVIVYLDENTGILVLRVLHGRQDWLGLPTH